MKHHKQVLIIQVQSHSPDTDTQINELIYSAIENSNPMGNLQEEQGGDWINFIITTNNLKETWATLLKALSENTAVFGKLSQRWIVVAEGSNGWSNYKTLAHFDPEVRLDVV